MSRYRTNVAYIESVARMVRAAGRRVATGDVSDLTELVALSDELSHAIAEGVAGLRAAGVFWESIGEATGTTKQAAIKKWRYRAMLINAGRADSRAQRRTPLDPSNPLRR